MCVCVRVRVSKCVQEREGEGKRKERRIDFEESCSRLVHPLQCRFHCMRRGWKRPTARSRRGWTYKRPGMVVVRVQLTTACLHIAIDAELPGDFNPTVRGIRGSVKFVSNGPSLIGASQRGQCSFACIPRLLHKNIHEHFTHPLSHAHVQTYKHTLAHTHEHLSTHTHTCEWVDTGRDIEKQRVVNKCVDVGSGSSEDRERCFQEET